MNRNNYSKILIVLSIVFQNCYFHVRNNEPYQYIFAVGFRINEESETVLPLDILAICLPVIFFIFYFSGWYTDYVEGYGRLLIIRNYSRTRMILNQCCRMAVHLILFQLIITAVYHWHQQGFTPFSGSLLQIETGYFITIYVLLLFQFFLETWMPVQIASLITNLYLISSVILQEQTVSGWVKLVFIPGNFIGTHNYALIPAVLKTDIENSALPGYPALMLFEIAVGVLLIIFAIAVCRKKDIL
ncbi:MAG: DUF2705 family protein [Lachnospiraceae bacterium]|nr:DUF2705 family protein [Lachnospiraceae bacterium]